MTDDELTSPSLDRAMERVKGGVKKLAGAALGDDELRREGELHDDKADAMVEAQRAEVEAEQSRREAEDDRRAAELTSEQRALLAEEAAEQHLERIERQRDDVEAAIDERHDRRREATEQELRQEQTRHRLRRGPCRPGAHA